MDNRVGKVMTVQGLVDPSTLGATLTHEHLFFNLDYYFEDIEDPEKKKMFTSPLDMKILHYVSYDPYCNKENCQMQDLDIALYEVGLFKKAGGGTICDLTAGGVNFFNRPIEHLRTISERTGIKVVANVTHHQKSGHPPYVAKGTADDVAKVFLNDIQNGVRDTGIYPGIIGEVGCGYVFHEDEKKVARGAARAHRESGIPISFHVHPPKRHDHEIMKIMKEEGVKPEHVVLGHRDGVLTHKDLSWHEKIDYLCSIADYGCYIQFDQCGNQYHCKAENDGWWFASDRERAAALFQLVLRGYEDQILLSHDCGQRNFLAYYGAWGISHILTNFHETMLEAGLDEKVIHKFSYENPARMLTICEKY
ncbi:phosphotriesterase [Agathobaculum sp. TL06]